MDMTASLSLSLVFVISCADVQTLLSKAYVTNDMWLQNPDIESNSTEFHAQVCIANYNMIVQY